MWMNMPLSFSLSVKWSNLQRKKQFRKSNRQYLKNQQTVFSSPDSPCQTVLEFPELHARQFWILLAFYSPLVCLFVRYVLSSLSWVVSLLSWDPETWSMTLRKPREMIMMVIIMMMVMVRGIRNLTVAREGVVGFPNWHVSGCPRPTSRNKWVGEPD